MRAVRLATRLTKRDRDGLAPVGDERAVRRARVQRAVLEFVHDDTHFVAVVVMQ